MNAYELADELLANLTQEYDCDDYMKEAANMLRQQADRISGLEKERRIDAIERATEKPCGWFGYYEGKICTFIFKEEDVDEFLKNTDPVGKVRPVYETPQTSAEPVAWINRYEDGSHGYLRWDKDDSADLCTPLYTTPQTKLSDEEIWEISHPYGDLAWQDDTLAFARAIEKEHGIV